MSAASSASGAIVCAPGYVAKQIVPGSGFHTLNGIALAPNGRVLAASGVGEAIFAFDRASGQIETLVGPPLGEADDLVVTKAGEVIWTAVQEGAVRRRDVDGHIRDLATNLPGINSIALTRDGQRLFVGRAFTGDGLWEIDLAGQQPPREVVAKLGGLNAFDFGPDGFIYGPAWDKGEVLRIDPESGAYTTIARGFKNPGSVKFDKHDALYVLDDATGQLFCLDPASGQYQLLAQLPSATDNMLVDEQNKLLVSNVADNSLHEVDPATGAVRLLVQGALAFPRAIITTSSPDGDRVLVADTGSVRSANPRTGQVTEIARAIASKLQFPTGISVGAGHLVLTSEPMGTVQFLDSATGQVLREFSGFTGCCVALEMPNGDLIVSEPAAGQVVRQRGDTKETLVAGLHMPGAMCQAPGDALYLAESTAGRLLRLDLSTGQLTPVATDLGAISAIATAPDGTVVVLDTRGKQVWAVNPLTGAKRLVAHNLAVGHLHAPYARSGGVAVGSDGTLYIAADVENALYQITTA